MLGKDIKLGIRTVKSIDIVKAGFTLGIGHLVLPFIPFKKASRFEAFKDVNKKGKRK